MVEVLERYLYQMGPHRRGLLSQKGRSEHSVPTDMRAADRRR
jgi:hypothetical protein